MSITSPLQTKINFCSFINLCYVLVTTDCRFSSSHFTFHKRSDNLPFLERNQCHVYIYRSCSFQTHWRLNWKSRNLASFKRREIRTGRREIESSSSCSLHAAFAWAEVLLLSWKALTAVGKPPSRFGFFRWVPWDIHRGSSDARD